MFTDYSVLEVVKNILRASVPGIAGKALRQMRACPFEDALDCLQSYTSFVHRVCQALSQSRNISPRGILCGRSECPSFRRWIHFESQNLNAPQGNIAMCHCTKSEDFVGRKTRHEKRVHEYSSATKKVPLLFASCVNSAHTRKSMNSTKPGAFPTKQSVHHKSPGSSLNPTST